MSKYYTAFGTIENFSEEKNIQEEKTILTKPPGSNVKPIWSGSTNYAIVNPQKNNQLCVQKQTSRFKITTDPKQGKAGYQFSQGPLFCSPTNNFGTTVDNLLRPKSFYIKGGRSGKYCTDSEYIDTTDNNKTKTKISCDSDNLTPNNIFKGEWQTDGTVAIKGGRANKYCSSGPSNINCTSMSITPETKYSIVDKYDPENNKEYYYLLNNGKFCSDTPAGLICNKGVASEWEQQFIGSV